MALKIMGVEGAYVTYRKKLDSGDYDTTENELCGAESLDIAEGSASTETVTALCEAARKIKRVVTGEVEAGDVSINFIRFDPENEGVKAFIDLPVNSDFLLEIRTTTKGNEEGQGMAMECTKTENFKVKIEKGKSISATLNIALIGAVKFFRVDKDGQRI